jgi:ATP-dependent Clp protease protease subunit
MNNNLASPIQGYYPTPTIYDNLPGGIVRAWDVASKLLDEERTIFLDGVFNDAMARSIVMQLMYLKAQSKDKLITIYVNSPGGSVSSGLAIYDAMTTIGCDISTVVMGLAASMGSFIAMSGTKGLRFAGPSAEIMTHQPSGGAQGQATDILIAAKHIERTRSKLTSRYQHHCGGELKDWEQLMDRDAWHTAEEAKALGLVDKIIGVDA